MGRERIDLSERSSEAYAIERTEPVITNDIALETRFVFPPFLVEHGVIALVNVPILLPGRTPFGVLQVDARRVRTFDREDIAFLKTYAMTLGPVIDRLKTVAELRATDERLRLFVENARAYVLIVSDAEDRITDWLGGSQEILGWSAAEVMGQRTDLIFTDEDRAAGIPERELSGAREHGAAANVRWHRRKDGSAVFLDGQTIALKDPREGLRGYLKIGRDVTEDKLGQQRLEESEERLSSAIEVGQLGLWDWNVRTGEVHWSDGHFRMQGYVVGEVTPSYEAWASRLHPEDRAATEAALQAAMDSRTEYAREFRTVRPDGEVRWHYARGRFSYDEHGRPVRMVGAMVDITERRQWEEIQKVLVAELQHRTRNLIGIIRSLADRTARASTDLPDFSARFADRMDALARVQGLLSRLGEQDRVTFDELIHLELSAVGGQPERMRLEGPKGIRLRSSTVQTLAMALHELATNAMKYGALRQPQAHLQVTWSFEAEGPGGKPWLHIDWRETGVEVPAAGAPRAGQGRELIEQALPYQLGAKTTYALDADGVHCTISTPVSLQGPPPAA
ncbi:PAS domain-containing protein [Phenylobacterium sp. J426]|uniref:PAS domain-containing protein n=1 Tax=Phenylobacterium sp. J426 TaxID=2898439 RepID=UPI0021506D97|nr:PAS domain-containing protein [Phenylobacterium sp. J426]MCR5875046.1 PAS domain-containing protein [Phenylobacterium sp. J426]